MQTVLSSDGTHIAVERTGAGPPLVFVHGGWTDHRSWRFVLPILARDFTVYAMDRRGCGESEPYRRGHAMQREFEDVAAVVQMVGKRVHLIGHSVGALCALHGALLTPSVRRLVLYEPDLGGADGRRLDVLDQIEGRIACGDVEGAHLLFRHEVTGSRRLTRDQLRATPNYAATVARTPSLVIGLAALWRFRFDAVPLRTLVAPTFLLAGAATKPHFAQAATAVAAALPHATVRVLPGQGHGAHMNAPALLAAEIVRFLTVPDNRA